MAEASLQDRLRNHAKAFDGLLSLIPATQYYGEDNSDQWQKKKQTKKEAAAARRGKLDPDSERHRNAKDVMDERARNKRKLREEEKEEEDEAEDGKEEEEEEEGGDDEDDSSFVAIEGVQAERPGEGLKKATERPAKKQKVQAEEVDDGDGDKEKQVSEDDDDEIKLSKKEQKRAAKRERKAEKKAAKSKAGIQKQATPNAKPSEDQGADETSGAKKKAKKEKKAKADKKAKTDEKKAKPDADADADANAEKVSGLSHKDDTEAASGLDDKVNTEAASGLNNKDDSEAASSPPSPTFDVTDPASTTTSVSSIIPPSEKPKQIVIPKDTSALRARLAAKIEALRAARKADGPDGKPIRTRQELIEARRLKQVQRKEHKKELRRQAKLEEERKREEALATNSPGIASPGVDVDEGGFSFGRVAFTDGTRMSHDLSYVLNDGKRKGPSDAKTALIKVQNQKKRLEGMEAEKRADVAEKESWLSARRRVEGEKIRDDEAILKKTIRRKEADKRKSEKAWSERAKGVVLAQKERAKKREDNLRKRRDEKLLGKAGKKKKKKGVASGGGKKKGGRPGFEGRFG